MNSSVVSVVTTSASVDVWSPVVIMLIPVLVMLLKRLVPAEFKNEIKIVYPIAALVLGPLVDYAFTWFTSHQTGPHAVLFGLVAIGLREAVDQGRKLVGTPAAKLVMVCILAGAVSGCATGSGNVFAHLQQFSADDLQAALDDAKFHNDMVAADCWNTLLGLINAGVPKPPDVKGIATAVQLKRDLTGAVGPSKIGEVRRLINRGCAALFLEENAALIKFGAPFFGLPALP